MLQTVEDVLWEWNKFMWPKGSDRSKYIYVSAPIWKGYLVMNKYSTNIKN
jgi:hypothetical protein